MISNYLKQVFVKVSKFCAYQERTHQEVRTKLREYQCYGDDAEEVIVALIEDNFINEERFAKSFARGKFRLKYWGKTKIKHELKQRGLSKYCINSGLSEIPDDEYEATICRLIEKKKEEISGETIFVQKGKITKYLLQKGYEQDIISDLVKDLVK